MNSDFPGPVNIGSEEMVTINELAEKVIAISGKNLSIKNIQGPTGVRGRNSDNTLIRKKLGWDYSQSLNTGLTKAYEWINLQVKENRYKDNELKVLLQLGDHD
jgi:nucleoside-diphosphate-sugar epimerase